MTPDHTPSVEVTQREELTERYLTDLAVHPYSTLRESATRLNVSNEALGSVVQRLRRDGRVESKVRKWSRARTFWLTHEDAIDLKAMQEWLENGAGTATVQDLVKALLRVTREVSRLRNVVLQERVDRIAAQMLAGKR